MVMVSITKSQSVKSICHATKPDGEPGSRAMYAWTKKIKNKKIHTPTALNEQLLKLILKIWWYNEAIIPLQAADSILLTSAFS